MLTTPVSLPGNGLLPKGGKEAMHSNEAIHKVIGDAVEKGSGGKITRDIDGERGDLDTNERVLLTSHDEESNRCCADQVT